MRTSIVGGLVVVVAALSLFGCGDDGGGGDEPTIERDQALAVLLQQGYTREGAECVIENAELQNVDLRSVFTRDQITSRELEVLASVQDFCLDRFPIPTTADTGSVTTPTTG
jgi:hypothetical protein